MAEAPIAPATRFATPEEMQTADQQPLQDRLAQHVQGSTGKPASGPVASAASDTGQQASPSPAASPVDDSGLRNIYANSLVQGTAQGPDDFANAWAQAHAKNGNIPPVHPDELAASLPTNHELTDYSIALADDNSIPKDPRVIRAIHQNLADAWAVTGASPADIYKLTQSNSSLSDALTRPQPAPQGIQNANPTTATNKEDFLEHLARGESAGDYNVLYGGGSMKGLPTDETGFPQWTGKDNSHAAGKYQFEPATWHAEYQKLGLTGGMTPANQDLAAWDLAQDDYKRRTGNDLSADLAAGTNGTKIDNALHSTWTSLGTGIANAYHVARNYVENELAPVAKKALGAAEGTLLPKWMQPEGATDLGQTAAKAVNDAIVGYGDWVMKGPLFTGMTPADINKLAMGFGTDAGGAAMGAIKSVEEGAAESALKGMGEKEIQTAAVQAVANVKASGYAKILAPTEEAGRIFQAPEMGTAAQRAGKNLVIQETGLARQAIAQAKVELQGFQRQVQKYVPEYQEWLNSTAQQDLRTIRDNHLDLIDHLTQGGKQEDFTPTRPAPVLPAIQRLTDHMEGVPGARLQPTDELYPVAEAIRQVYQGVRQKIADAGYDTSSYLDDYYRHAWADPTRVDQTLGTGGRLGSGASLKQRTIPTINDGILSGLKPKILDPIENTLNYVSGMQNFLAGKNVVRLGEEQGWVHWSPSWEPGMEPLTGNGATRYGNLPRATERAWADPGFATAYNNWAGRGFYDWGKTAGDILSKVQTVSNGMTGLKLAVSGYHAVAVSVESVAAGVANGIGELAHGDMLHAARDLGLSLTFTKPIRDVAVGRAGIARYLSGTDEVGNLYAKAGGRVLGRGDEYGAQMGNLWQQIRGGVWKDTFANDLKGIGGKVDEAFFGRAIQAPFRAAGVVLHQINGVLGSITAPLFDYAIPAIKYANFSDEMQSYLRAYPAATEEAKVTYARTLQRTMDDRFGELVQDNLNMRRELKQIINNSVVSLGWEYGTLRGFAGAAKDVMTGHLLTPRARWTIGFVAATAYASNIYQYLKTGTTSIGSPTPFLDMILPRNGTTNPDGTPGRGILPGYQKDVIQWYKAFTTAPGEPLKALGSIADAKFNPFMQTVHGVATGKTWMGTDINRSYRGPGGNTVPTGIFPNTNYTPTTPNAVPEWWTSYLDYVADQMAPIGLEQAGQKGIHFPEGGLGGLGIRPAPPVLGDQPAFEKSQEALDKRATAEGLGYARYQNKQLENPIPEIPMTTPRTPTPTKGKRRL